MDIITEYKNDIDNILWDLLGDNPFKQTDLDEIINIVTLTIYQYNKKIKQSNLKLIVKYVIELKYNIIYVYDKENEPERLTITTIDNDSRSSDLSLDGLIIDEEQIENKYINSEMDIVEKVQLSSAKDLISYRYNYDKEKFINKKYIRRQKRIVTIKTIPQHEQKSQAWLDQRNECITATAVATALDEDPYKYPCELLMDKCGRGVPFVENANVHHGKKYEEIGSMFYSYRNNVAMAEYGLLQDEDYPFIGASPDGICEKNTYDGKGLTKLVGRLLEIKFPKTRQILTSGDLNGDICPRQYFLQCITQMFVTKMDECDFLQCKMDEYDSYDDFVKDSQQKIPGLSKQTNLEKGCIIQLLPKKMINDDDKLMCLYNAKYLYPSKLHMTLDETDKWIASELINFESNELSNEFMIDKVIYWKFDKITCHVIKADHQYMIDRMPQLTQFWKYVEFYRKHSSLLDELEEYIKDVGNDKTADIFQKVNQDYLKFHKNSKYKPLYQEVNEWRKKYNAKKALYLNRYKKKN